MSAKVQKPRPRRAKREERPVPVRTTAGPNEHRTAGGSAPSAIEYGILVAGLAVVIIALVFMLGPRVRRMVEGLRGDAHPAAPASAPAAPAAPVAPAAPSAP